MATKIPPKNFDNKLSRRKQDLDQIAKNEEDIAALQALPVLPTPAAGDTGKVPKVNSEGEYFLETIRELPVVSTSNNNDVLQVQNGNWTNASLGTKLNTLWGTGAGVIANGAVTGITQGSYHNAYLANYRNGYHYFIKAGVDSANTQTYEMTSYINNNGVYESVFTNVTDKIRVIRFYSNQTNGIYEEVDLVKYVSVTVTSGLNAISLPDSMTFDDLKALLDVSTVYIVDDDTSDIYSIERYDGSTALFRHIGLSTAYVLIDSIEFNNLGGTYSEARVEIYTPNP